jgi:hypothetical protein
MEFQSTIRSLMRPQTAPASNVTTSYKTNIDEESNFKVCVRIRPESSREQQGNHHLVVQALDQNVLVFDPKPDSTPNFDAVRGNVRSNPRVLQKRARSNFCV